MAASRTIRITLDVTYRDLTAEEIVDDGLDDVCEPGQEPEDCLPDCCDFSADEGADLISHRLLDEEVQAEMFAGTGIFAKIASVNVVSAADTSRPA